MQSASLNAGTLLEEGTTIQARVAEVADEQLSPLANRIDQEGFYPKEVLGNLGEAGAFSVHLDRYGARFDVAIANMQSISRNCGSTGFVAWCQDVCGLYMEQSGNSHLLDRLDDQAFARRLGGTGLSNPMKSLTGIETMALIAKPVDGGYQVSGTLPWVSNISADQYFGGIATVKAADGNRSHEIFFVIDIGDTATISKCPKFSGMEGTSTWSVTLDSYFVSESKIIADPALPFIKRVRPAFILLQTGFGLGVIEKSIDACREVESSLGHVNQFLHDRPDELQREYEDLRERIMSLAKESPYGQTKEYVIDVLDVRAHTSELSLKASQSALLHQGARGYLMHSTPQRLIREAHFVAILTPAIKHLRWEMAKLMKEDSPQ